MTWLAVVSAAFVVVALAAHDLTRGTAFDHDVLSWMMDHQRGWLTTVSVALTSVASPRATGLLAMAAALVIGWRRRRIAPALVVVGTVVVANAIVAVVKRLVAEQRPPGSREFLLGIAHSFPSGHVTGTLALTGIVAVVVGHGRAANVSASLGLLVAVVTSVVAFSRLYLGVHWATDIAGGLLLGAMAVLIGSRIASCLRLAASPTVSPATRLDDGDSSAPSRRRPHQRAHRT